MVQFEEEKQQRKLDLLHRKEEEESVKILSQKYKISYVNLLVTPIETDALKILSEDKARTGNLAIFKMAGKHLKIAVQNPQKTETAAALKRLETDEYTYELFLVSIHSLLHAWEIYKMVPENREVIGGSIHVSNEKISAFQKELHGLEAIKNTIDGTTRARATEALEIIIAGALNMEASDVHIEPEAAQVRLRYRLDGILHDVTFLPTKLYALLLSRIKLISDLKLNIHDRAQDGRFTIKTDRTEVEVRTSIIPGSNGENMVLRILNPDSLDVKFEDLGMQTWTRQTIEKELKKPNGMIITTGPTGSGKTTTLYTMLKKIYSPEIKVITLEDPIEYHLTGVEQTQVDPAKGYNFPEGLRAIVRQDPDVILVGEIRDSETADTALNAALTGHLVFSTLHTNNAAGAIPRLISLGVKASAIAPAINVAMAQRLVRKLCESCKKKVSLTPAQAAQIKERLAAFPKGIPIPKPNELAVYQAKENGCPVCSGMGYKKRVGVFEIILIENEIELLILREPSEFEIKKAAVAQKQITMAQDGLLKILAGITSFEEVERVVGI